MAKYTVLGKALDRIARERDVNGPKEIAEYVQTKTGEGPSRSAWQQILTGDTKNPKERTLELFLVAFEATPEECREVALKHLFRRELATPPLGSLAA